MGPIQASPPSFWAWTNPRGSRCLHGGTLADCRPAYSIEIVNHKTFHLCNPCVSRVLRAAENETAVSVTELLTLEFPGDIASGHSYMLLLHARLYRSRSGGQEGSRLALLRGRGGRSSAALSGIVTHGRGARFGVAGCLYPCGFVAGQPVQRQRPHHKKVMRLYDPA